ncbi:PRC-barrel domain-containing protein [Rubrivirga sp.]|uniref:PRC-barrel domain-containing protein n=1 Tax=Rubrivirga sp. TaxID=1885344 RepID=UPI003C76A56E
MNTLLSSSSIENTTIVNPQGESLGSIKDLMIDPQSGRVQYAVLDFGGFLGIGDKLFAVPLEAFTIDRTDERFVLDVPKDRFENAPGFPVNDWPSNPDPQFVEGVYDYYGQRETYLRTRINEPVLSN